MQGIQTSLLVIVAIVAVVKGYPSGAPPEACVSLNPTSHGPSTAKGSPPYTLTVGAKSYQPSQKIEVTLAGVGSAMFKGFLVEGRSVSGKNTVGMFTNTTTAKAVCDTGKGGNGITHINAAPKSAQTFVWQAPSTNAGDVVFHYTVVRGGAPNTTADPADYFMDIQSPSLPAASTDTSVPINIV